MRRARDSGHRIGNHTWSHSGPLGPLPPERALEEFDRCAEVLASLGVQERLFRPQGRASIGPHLLQPVVVDRLTQGGYTCVTWNSVPGDYRDEDGWMARALVDLRTREHSLLVLHDIAGAAITHLDEFLAQLAAEHEIVREFPADCLPIVEGRIVLPMAGYSA